MTVLVHFSGPSYSKSVVLEPAAPPIDVGRDARAGVHLPDDDRLISRRHCTLEWAEGGALVTILSKVNGITTQRGALNQGESIVLAPGESAQLGHFTFVVEDAGAEAPTQLAAAAAEPAEAESAAGPSTVFDEPFARTVQAPLPQPQPPGEKAADPWAEFASEWIPPGAKSQKNRAAAFPPPSQSPLNRAFDDAFSSSTAWHVQDMPAAEPDPLASASFESEKVLNAAFSVPPPAAPAGTDATGAALQALCKGLGIGGPRQLTEAEWEHLGRSMRQAVEALGELMNVRAQLKRELRAADRTMLATPAESNPLQSGMPMDELLHYLLFMPQGGAGYLPAPRALAEAVADLRAHELASVAAARAAVEGTLAEFEPEKLRGTLMKGKRSFAAAIDKARLWDLYAAHYESQGRQRADWLEQLFNRHFMPAYLREADRLRREAQAQQAPPERTD